MVVTAPPACVTASCTATPAATPAPPTAVPPTAVPAPLTPNQRLAQARDTAEAGNFSSALATLDELRQATRPWPAWTPPTTTSTWRSRSRYSEQSNPDGAYEQFGAALKVRPNDPTAKAGQDEIILAKNYAIMEAAWGKDDDAAIKALEENMLMNPASVRPAPKLYALLIMKADRLLGPASATRAFPSLMRALDVLPDAGEAQKRLASYTPTPDARSRQPRPPPRHRRSSETAPRPRAPPRQRGPRAAATQLAEQSPGRTTRPCRGSRAR